MGLLWKEKEKKHVVAEFHETELDMWYYSTNWLPRDNQRDGEQQTLLKSIRSHREYIPVWKQLATDQTDPWQVVPRQVFSLYSPPVYFNCFCCCQSHWLALGHQCVLVETTCFKLNR